MTWKGLFWSYVALRRGRLVLMVEEVDAPPGTDVTAINTIAGALDLA